MSIVATIRRNPTVEEYADLIASVGWKPRDVQAVRTALNNSLFSVVARTDDILVGMGRVIGDGELHYYLSDLVVRPEFQRKGVGSAIVRELQQFIDTVPYKNTLVGIIATERSREFYERLGYKAQRPDAPAMYRWMNPGAAA